MTLTDIIKKINQTMGEEENTTPDYDWKLNEIIDSIQKEIATKGKLIKKSKYVSADSGLISLPSDVYELIKLNDDENNTVQYAQIDKKTIQITEDDGDYTITYFAYPNDIKSTTSRSTELEIPIETHDILKFGVCAELTISDDPRKYSIFNSKYETSFANLLDVTNKNKAITIAGGIRL
jgi:hypothetical protein